MKRQRSAWAIDYYDDATPEPNLLLITLIGFTTSTCRLPTAQVRFSGDDRSRGEERTRGAVVKAARVRE